MNSVKVKSWIPLFLLLSLVSVQSEQYHSYSWHGYKLRKWHDFPSLVIFDSRRLHPISTTTIPKENGYPDAPVGPHLHPPDYDYDPSLKDTSVDDDKKKGRETFNITIERFGGFGGTGDLAGYGAYEFRKNDDHLSDSPYPDVLRKSHGSVINSILNIHPLPPA